MALFSRNDKKEEPLAPVSPTPSLRPASAPTSPSTPVAAQTPKPEPKPELKPEVKMEVKPEPPSLSEAGTLDFNAIYQYATVPAVPFTAEQTIEMLDQLPGAMPLEMKRQTVQVTLTALGSAIGANRDSIVGDATQKRNTLNQYADTQGKKTDSYVAGAEAEIAELQRQIAKKEGEIADAKGKQERIRTLCDTEAARLDSVLSFFGSAAPKLQLTTEAPKIPLLNDEDEKEALPKAA